MAATTDVIPQILTKHENYLLGQWLAKLTASGVEVGDKTELNDQARRFVAGLRKGSEGGRPDNISGPEWADARAVLEDVSRSGTMRGATPSQIATFVFSLKEPLFELLRRENGSDAGKLAGEIWTATQLLDRLGLYTTEIFQRSREEVIARQQDELLELSTPVVKLWEGVLALPIIGTLDSARTQVVMENLLQEIVNSGAEIAIVDITGVPTVDTVVAQHLLKTISAARLMGADCIISGIRPQIAQTIVHLGVELSVVSKATMADAFALALRRLGKTITDRERKSPVKAD
ncbi:MAG TPA: STAS domain-containing protein [Alphaproteobacteria bacterium]|jgi:rsbT co-antagonist protein RsbR|nr:STAS domain-containing protein [Alphaproteobacteria bacterium]